jgi:RND superfamily putative drug exporter
MSSVRTESTTHCRSSGFIFLVAFGIDYTIFLMSRVREKARRFGTREGTLRALGATGPVITSAGIILAGTFSVLMTLPVWFIFNIGSWWLSAFSSTRS